MEIYRLIINNYLTLLKIKKIMKLTEEEKEFLRNLLEDVLFNYDEILEEQGYQYLYARGMMRSIGEKLEINIQTVL